MRPLPLEVQYSALIEKSSRNKDGGVVESLLEIWVTIEKHPQLTITARRRLRVQVQDALEKLGKAGRVLPRSLETENR
jgi:hypothetical protein